MPDQDARDMIRADDAELIRRTVYLHAQYLDDGRFEFLPLLYTPDARLVTAAREWTGSERIAAVLAKAQPPERRGKHCCLNTVISRDAAADWVAVTDYVFIGPDKMVSAVGRYHDTMTYVGHAWLIAQRRIEAGS